MIGAQVSKDFCKSLAKFHEKFLRFPFSARSVLGFVGCLIAISLSSSAHAFLQEDKIKIQEEIDAAAKAISDCKTDTEKRVALAKKLEKKIPREKKAREALQKEVDALLGDGVLDLEAEGACTQCSWAPHNGCKEDFDRYVGPVTTAMTWADRRNNDPTQSSDFQQYCSQLYRMATKKKRAFEEHGFTQSCEDILDDCPFVQRMKATDTLKDKNEECKKGLADKQAELDSAKARMAELLKSGVCTNCGRAGGGPGMGGTVPDGHYHMNNAELLAMFGLPFASSVIGAGLNYGMQSNLINTMGALGTTQSNNWNLQAQQYLAQCANAGVPCAPPMMPPIGMGGMFGGMMNGMGMMGMMGGMMMGGMGMMPGMMMGGMMMGMPGMMMGGMMPGMMMGGMMMGMPGMMMGMPGMMMGMPGMMMGGMMPGMIMGGGMIVGMPGMMMVGMMPGMMMGGGMMPGMMMGGMGMMPGMMMGGMYPGMMPGMMMGGMGMMPGMMMGGMYPGMMMSGGIYPGMMMGATMPPGMMMSGGMYPGMGMPGMGFSGYPGMGMGMGMGYPGMGNPYAMGGGYAPYSGLGYGNGMMGALGGSQMYSIYGHQGMVDSAIAAQQMGMGGGMGYPGMGSGFGGMPYPMGGGGYPYSPYSYPYLR